MATFQKNYESDQLAANVRIDLRRRTVDGSAQFYAVVLVSFNGGAKTITKKVLLDDLSATDRNALIQGGSALHALALAAISADDF